MSFLVKRNEGEESLINIRTVKWGDCTSAIIGPEGIGKTMTALVTKNEKEKQNHKVIYIHDKCNSYEHFFRKVVGYFKISGLSSGKEMEMCFIHELENAANLNQNIIIMIDNCHYFDQELIEKIDEFVNYIPLIHPNLSLIFSSVALNFFTNFYWLTYPAF